MRYRSADRLQLIFLAIFIGLAVALLFIHGPPQRPVAAPKPPSVATLKDPKARCEAMGDWWDPQTASCAVPMPISHFTGRPVKR